MSYQGNPCWYELSTTNPAEAGAFYAKVLGWQISDAGTPGFDYTLASMGDDMVAGLAASPDDTPPHWLIYFAVDDCDATTRAMLADGVKVLTDPQDIPNTGRFAIIADPQGARFGILQPDMTGMSDADKARAKAGEGAFNQKKAGHGNWNELMSTDPAASFAFYARHLGWTRGDAMDMGEMGTYQLVRHKGTDIGAVMGLGVAPMPNWLPYFGVNGSVSTVMETIKTEGGHIHHGPQEVPGGAFIAIGHDPQGAWFAVVGPER